MDKSVGFVNGETFEHTWNGITNLYAVYATNRDDFPYGVSVMTPGLTRTGTAALFATWGELDVFLRGLENTPGCTVVRLPSAVSE